MHSDWESGEMHKGMFVEASGSGEDVNKIEKRKKGYLAFCILNFVFELNEIFEWSRKKFLDNNNNNKRMLMREWISVWIRNNSSVTLNIKSSIFFFLMIIVFIHTERKVCVERDAETKICRINMNFSGVCECLHCHLRWYLHWLHTAATKRWITTLSRISLPQSSILISVSTLVIAYIPPSNCFLLPLFVLYTQSVIFVSSSSPIYKLADTCTLFPHSVECVYLFSCLHLRTSGIMNGSRMC